MSTIFDSPAGQGHLRLMTTSDLQNVFKLRNHPKIRNFMLTQHEISFEEHVSWFERASVNPGLELLIFEHDKICLGFVQFNETRYHGVVDWGFYSAPDAPKGTGRKLGQAALQHVFKKDNLHKVCGQALHWNQPSIQFHKSLGFSQEGTLRAHHFDGAAYHDLICFGLLRLEWVANDSLTGINR